MEEGNDKGCAALTEVSGCNVSVVYMRSDLQKRQHAKLV